jgi:hypothetical protein
LFALLAREQLVGVFSDAGLREILRDPSLNSSSIGEGLVTNGFAATQAEWDFTSAPQSVDQAGLCVSKPGYTDDNLTACEALAFHSNAPNATIVVVGLLNRGTLKMPNGDVVPVDATNARLTEFGTKFGAKLKTYLEGP